VIVQDGLQGATMSRSLKQFVLFVEEIVMPNGANS
jgi:hypothetical protein